MISRPLVPYEIPGYYVRYFTTACPIQNSRILRHISRPLIPYEIPGYYVTLFHDRLFHTKFQGIMSRYFTTAFSIQNSRIVRHIISRPLVPYKIPGYYVGLFHNHLLLHPFQFIIYQPLIIRRCLIQTTECVVKNIISKQTQFCRTPSSPGRCWKQTECVFPACRYMTRAQYCHSAIRMLSFDQIVNSEHSGWEFYDPTCCNWFAYKHTMVYA